MHHIQLVLKQGCDLGEIGRCVPGAVKKNNVWLCNRHLDLCVVVRLEWLEADGFMLEAGQLSSYSDGRASC